MVSSEPLPDRCGAQVTSKVGLVIDADDVEGVLDDTVVSKVRLEKGAVSQVHPTEYEQCREYLHNGHRIRAIKITDVGFDTDRIDEACEIEEREDGDVWVTLEDHDPYVTHRDTELDGYCEKWPSVQEEGAERCYLHGASAGPNEGNTNAMKHALYAQRSNYFQSLPVPEQDHIEALANSWIDNTDQFDRDNIAKVNEIWRCAIDQHRLWNALDEFENEEMIMEQIVGTDPNSGEPQEAVDEHPINLPYSRLDRDVQSRLEDLGVFDEDEEEDSTAESLASALADLAQD